MVKQRLATSLYASVLFTILGAIAWGAANPFYSRVSGRQRLFWRSTDAENGPGHTESSRVTVSVPVLD